MGLCLKNPEEPQNKPKEKFEGNDHKTNMQKVHNIK